MPVTTPETGWTEVGYATEPVTLETYTEYDPVTMRNVVRIRPQQEYNRERYYSGSSRDIAYSETYSSEPLADWEKELLNMGGGCSCMMCQSKNSGPTVVNTKCNDCGKLETKVLRLTDELAEAKKKADEYDKEAGALAKELERVMTARDELAEVLAWYEDTE